MLARARRAAWWTLPLLAAMLSLLAFLFFAPAVLVLPMSAAAPSPSAPPLSSIRFENVPGFFAQDDPATNSSTFDFIKSNFGLKPEFKVQGLDTEELAATEDEKEVEAGAPPWGRFKRAIEQLNRKAPRNTEYKVFFLARHGEGFHNVAESFYGTPAWNCFWSLQTGNGTIVWGPDALLTPLGMTQAAAANGAWKTQRKLGVPLPQSFYSSPLSRAASTLEITWGDITLNKPHEFPAPLVKELWRETIGLHTCDQRRSATYIRATYPNLRIEPGFAENDPLWTPEVEESNSEQRVRATKVLSEVLASDRSTYISVSAHSGILGAVLQVIGHQPFGLATGAMIPVVLKVRFDVKEPPTPTSVLPGTPAPTCASGVIVPTITSTGSA